MKIGILDFGEIDANSNAIETIHHTIANAVLAEEKGFTRYWLTEHYLNTIAWRNPELIISLIAASTNTIKAGAAGVLTSVTTPYRLAQDYKLLSNLFPGRVDLGFAKARIEKGVAEEITERRVTPDFFESIRKTKRFLNNEMENINVSPVSAISPDLWMLGTSHSSVSFAVEMKMNFSLSLFHNLESLPASDILFNFKEKFIQQNGYEPEVNIAVSVFCSEDEVRIKQEKNTRRNVMLNACGNSHECMKTMKKLAREYGVEEVIVLNLGKDHAEKQILMETLLTATVNQSLQQKNLPGSC